MGFQTGAGIYFLRNTAFCTQTSSKKMDQDIIMKSYILFCVTAFREGW